MIIKDAESDNVKTAAAVRAILSEDPDVPALFGLSESEAALAAGAGFIVMPTLVEDVVAECVRRGVPVFPGALTPQEIHAAWRAGATDAAGWVSSFMGSLGGAIAAGSTNIQRNVIAERGYGLPRDWAAQRTK